MGAKATDDRPTASLREGAYTVAGPSELHLGPDDIYKPGDSVALPADVAGPLLADGVVVDPEAAAEARAAKFRAAIQGLDPDDPELWTKSGKAKTEALEAELGFEVSAGERDAAHAEIEAARKAAAEAEGKDEA